VEMGTVSCEWLGRDGDLPKAVDPRVVVQVPIGKSLAIARCGEYKGGAHHPSPRSHSGACSGADHRSTLGPAPRPT
jgi:hypothetical protein